MAYSQPFTNTHHPTATHHSFAQRVAQVRNDARCNEEVDPYQVIQRLRNELSTARAEVGYLRGEAGEGAPLGEAEQRAVAAACQEFVAQGRRRSLPLPDGGEEESSQEDAPPALGKLTLSRVYYAFRVLRAMVLAPEAGEGGWTAAGAVGMGSGHAAGRGTAVALASPLPVEAATATATATPVPSQSPVLEGPRAAGTGASPSPPSQPTLVPRRRPPSPTACVPVYVHRKTEGSVSRIDRLELNAHQHTTAGPRTPPCCATQAQRWRISWPVTHERRSWRRGSGRLRPNMLRQSSSGSKWRRCGAVTAVWIDVIFICILCSPWFACLYVCVIRT